MNPWFDFDNKWNLPPLPSANEPVFMLGSIWRSGSTLVQRLLCSDPDLFLWGEPYGDAGILPHLHQSAKALLRSEWPNINHFLIPGTEMTDIVMTAPQKHWIANLYPEPTAMRNSYRAMLDSLFMHTAASLGKKRFGIKEIRYDGYVAQFLQWLYPDARFVFLTRNPYDAWSSYKGSHWYYQYPKMLVKDVQVFAKLWKKNFESFLMFRQDPHAKYIFFEDLLQKKDENISLLEEHCRVSIDKETLNIRIRGMQKQAMPVTKREEDIIRKICKDLAEPCGYFGPKDTRRP